jgi:predicted DNA-binding protein
MKRLTLRISDEVHEFVKNKSFGTGKSMNEIMTDLIEKGMKKDKVEFDKRIQKEKEQIKNVQEVYKTDREKAKKMYKEITGENLPEWLWDIMEF